MATSAYAATPVVLEESQHTYSLALHFNFLEDTSGELTIEQVSSPTWDEQFIVNTNESPNFGFTSSAYWLRFDVHNDSNHERHMILHTGIPIMNRIDVYTSEEKSWEHWQTGDIFPFHQRPLEHSHFLFPISLEGNQSKTVYIRLKSATPLRLSATLLDALQAGVNSYRISWFFGLFYGVILAMSIYNLFLFFVVREALYLSYVAFNICILLGTLATEGHGYQFLWPDYPWWNSVSLQLTNMSGLAALLLLTQQALDLKQQMPKLFWFFNGLISIATVVALSAFVLPTEFSIKLLVVTGPPSVLIILLTTGYCWFRGILSANYIVLAWITFIISILLSIASTWQILPSTFWADNGRLLGP
ncbi:MAG: 7TM diverse intracellular signaling domain-containing protein, partial [Pseudomonadota bacterium]